MNFFPYRGQFCCASQGLCLQPHVESVVSSLDQGRRLPCPAVGARWAAEGGSGSGHPVCLPLPSQAHTGACLAEGAPVSDTVKVLAWRTGLKQWTDSALVILM